MLFHVRTVYEAAPQYSPRAYLAVDFFFVLSGFVMARAYEQKLRAGYGGDRFFKARYLRLWPTIAFGSLLFVPFVREAAGGFNLTFWRFGNVTTAMGPTAGLCLATNEARAKQGRESPNLARVSPTTALSGIRLLLCLSGR